MVGVGQVAGFHLVNDVDAVHVQRIRVWRHALGRSVLGSFVFGSFHGSRMAGIRQQLGQLRYGMGLGQTHDALR
jgi:hypothetical protein